MYQYTIYTKGWGRHNNFVQSVEYSGAGPESTQPPIRWIRGGTSRGVKRPGREGDHLPLTSAEVKNGGAVPPFPIHRHGAMIN
jgi:hypothetical protein